ncbi:glutaredoxin family protein [soil metagenome]
MSRSPAARLILFQRDDCHLCDLALEVLAAARVPEFDSVFIDGDAALEARYGLRVPVLREQVREREVDWPFDAARVHALLGR